MSWYCEKCRAVFDEPGYRVERNVHWWLEDKPTEELYFTVCPECGAEDITEAPECDYCEGAYLPEDMIGGTLCKCCFAEIVRARPDVVKAYIASDKEAFAEFVHDYPELH